MNTVPEYTGNALSFLTRAASAPEPNTNTALWSYGPMHRAVPDDLAEVNKLVAAGYVQITQTARKYHISELFSQLRETKIVAPGRNTEKAQLWVHVDDLEAVKRYPVTLAFPMEIEPPEQGVQPLEHIPMLQYLPPARLGECALIPISNDDQRKVKPYYITQLPKNAQERQQAMREKILELAAPGEWVPHTETHAMCASELTYVRLLNELHTRILARTKKERELARDSLAKLNESHDHVSRLRQSWLKLDWLLQWKEITRMAQELALDYYTFHTTKQRRNLPATIDAFSSPEKNSTSIWSALPIHAFTHAMSNAASGATRWVEEQIGESRFRASYKQKTGVKDSGSSTTIHVYSPADEQDVQKARDRVWEQIRRSSDLDGDVYLSMIVQLRNSAHSRDQNGFTWLVGSQVLDYRGITPRTEKTESGKVYSAGHRSEDIEDIAACIQRMRNTRITVDQVIYETTESASGRKRKKTTRFKRESPLFLFGEVITKEELWSDTPGMNATEVAWQIKESAWMEPFIQGPNAYEVMLLQSSLKYDPHNHKWEKRLSRYLMIHLQMNRHSTHIKRNIGALLKELSLESTKPHRTKDRFEKALNALKKDGHISRWHYADTVKLPAKNWLPTWLEQDILLYAPRTIEAGDRTNDDQ
jgi:hypothetical protein